ncbi:MAG TPA: peptidylprolyl isomerase [Verrucomicrobiae bacterium]|nr:peptidylprolyl isomerase [Verrucomicrobiae bacterium]
MKNKMKLIFPATLVAALIALPSAMAATAPAPTTTTTNAKPVNAMTALFGDPVMAKGKGFEIKQSEMDQVVTGIKSAAAAHNENIPAEQLNGIKAQMLNRLIQIQILLQQSTDADKLEGKKKADTQIAALLARAGSQEAFERQLKAVGMNLDELRTKITQEATATATLTRALGINVTDAEVKQYYDTHPADFEQPESVKVQHILMLTINPTTRAPLSDDQVKAKRAQIDDILKKVKAGEDFSKLATQYSEDPGSKEKGGELPAFSHGDMVPEFEAAAFSMKTNSISEVITTAYGYHVIKLLDKTPAKKLALTDKVPMSDLTISDKIKDYLVQQKTQKLAPVYLENLKKTANVEILDADMKAAIAALPAATNAPAEAP